MDFKGTNDLKIEQMKLFLCKLIVSKHKVLNCVLVRDKLIWVAELMAC